MTEEDIMGGVAREPLRSCCFKLAGQLWALCQHIGFADTYSLQVGFPACSDCSILFECLA
jgi:hypothetical protein